MCPSTRGHMFHEMPYGNLNRKMENVGKNDRIGDKEREKEEEEKKEEKKKRRKQELQFRGSRLNEMQNHVLARNILLPCECFLPTKLKRVDDPN